MGMGRMETWMDQRRGLWHPSPTRVVLVLVAATAPHQAHTTPRARLQEDLEEVTQPSKARAVLAQVLPHLRRRRQRQRAHSRPALRLRSRGQRRTVPHTWLVETGDPGDGW
jgi:hypothetical protein